VRSGRALPRLDQPRLPQSHRAAARATISSPPSTGLWIAAERPTNRARRDGAPSVLTTSWRSPLRLPSSTLRMYRATPWRCYSGVAPMVLAGMTPRTRRRGRASDTVSTSLKVRHLGRARGVVTRGAQPLHGRSNATCTSLLPLPSNVQFTGRSPAPNRAYTNASPDRGAPMTLGLPRIERCAERATGSSSCCAGARKHPTRISVRSLNCKVVS
jgi:hypothetical protein